MISTVFISIMLFIGEVIIEFFTEREAQMLENYVPEFAVTVIGVIMALTLEQTVISRRNEKRLSDIQKVIRKELLRAQGVVEEGEGHYIETQVWDSLINSGDAAKLPVNLQDDLFELYSDLREYNTRTSIIREKEKELIHLPIDSDRTTKKTEFQEFRTSITMGDSVLVDEIKQILDSTKWETTGSM